MNTVIDQYGQILLEAMGQTLLLALYGLLFACILGLIFGMLSVVKNKVCNVIAYIFVYAIRGVPMIVLAFFIFFGVPYLFNTIFEGLFAEKITLTALQAGTACLALNCGAYMSEIIRAGIQSVDRGQMEAARSIGFSHGQAMRLVVLPQAIRNILPALGNEFVTVIKESSIVSVIGLADLMFRTNDVIAVTYKSLACLAIAALCYFAMTFTGGRLISLAERKMNHGK